MNEKVFDFTCDARITTSIRADSLEEAMALWTKFCDLIDASDCLQTEYGDQFYVTTKPGRDIPKVDTPLDF